MEKMNKSTQRPLNKFWVYWHRCYEFPEKKEENEGAEKICKHFTNMTMLYNKPQYNKCRKIDHRKLSTEGVRLIKV
jgi:hypothetical protein